MIETWKYKVEYLNRTQEPSGIMDIRVTLYETRRDGYDQNQFSLTQSMDMLDGNPDILAYRLQNVIQKLKTRLSQMARVSFFESSYAPNPKNAAPEDSNEELELEIEPTPETPPNHPVADQLIWREIERQSLNPRYIPNPPEEWNLTLNDALVKASELITTLRMIKQHGDTNGWSSRAEVATYADQLASFVGLGYNILRLMETQGLLDGMQEKLRR